MNLSLNEIEVTAKKATRGAGFSWGQAEEAGKATRWLCAQNMAGVTELAGILREQRRAVPVLAPDGRWSADAVLCPLTTGIALVDFADRLRDGPIHIVGVAHPRMILPFAVAAARQLGAVLTLTCNGLTALTDGTGVDLKRMPHPPGTSDLTITCTGEMTTSLARVSRCVPDPSDWATLTAFAARTYAPATDASRMLGAGAGLSDND